MSGILWPTTRQDGETRIISTHGESTMRVLLLLASQVQVPLIDQVTKSKRFVVHGTSTKPSQLGRRGISRR